MRFAPEAYGLKADYLDSSKAWRDQKIQRAQCRILTIEQVLSKMRQSPIKVNISSAKANQTICQQQLHEKSSVYETDV